MWHFLTSKPRSQVPRSGFTMVEILIVVAITSLLAGIGFISYTNLRVKKALDTTLSRIVFDLRLASERSKVQQEDSAWGVRFVNGARDYYEMWSGTNYTSGVKYGRNALTTVQFSDPTEGNVKDILFARGTGLPSVLDGGGSPTGRNLVITNFTDTKTIVINENGRIDY